MKKHHNFTHSTIEHHDDKSHTITHHHKDGAHKDVKHAAANHDAMIDSMMEHTSAPNPGEGKDEDNEKMEEKVAPGIHSAVAAGGNVAPTPIPQPGA